MKKVLSLVLVFVLLACALVSCGGNDEDEEVADLMVGAILVGDESEGYTYAHMEGMEAAAAEIKAETGKIVELSYKKKVPEDNSVITNATSLIASGCSLIVTNSYGHQFQLNTETNSLVANNPDVQFVAMTGDLAAASGKSNYANAFTAVYESRYVSGVVAGLKLNELIAAGKLENKNYSSANTVRVGYVGAFNYAEVVSGYTAFYLGMKSVLTTGYNLDMTVKYTDSWFDPVKEASAADYLYNLGCVIIGQHADSTGAPDKIEQYYKNASKEAQDNWHCFNVAYNVDMLKVAPHVCLTSATNVWKVYYKELFTAMLNGTAVPTNWTKGYADGAVAITALNSDIVADGTQSAVDAVINNIKNGTLKVFDVSKFTVDGNTLTTYTGAWGMGGAECLVTDGGVTFFKESSLRSAPYFDIRIDGITEEAANAND